MNRRPLLVRLAGPILTLPLLALAASCADQDGRGGDRGPAVSDSAGVRIVVNRVPANGLPAFASLSPSPTLVIGAEGPAGTMAFGDVTGASNLPDGRIALTDGAAHEVRFYAAVGDFIVAVGGEGTEVGQFQSVSRMGRVAGDTVWVADHRAGQLSLVTPEGVAGRYPFPLGLTVAGRFGDDGYLMVPVWSPSLLREDWREGVRRDSASWGLWWPRGPAADQLPDFPHDEMMVLKGPEGPVAGVPPFGRRTSRVVGVEEFLVGDQVTFEIRRYRPDGALSGIIRLEGVDLTLTEALKASVRPPRAEGDTSLVDRFWEGVPPTRPAYTRLLLDGVGNLWVAEHVAGTEPPRTWMVFSPDGSVLGLVSVPPGFEVHEVGADWVLGAERTVGGTRVARYALSRTP